jgi:biopolymer transport protein ExbD
MADVTEINNGQRRKTRQKKMTVRVDFTPMVDMNMLLITFFMLCTSLIKPQTMEISMPSNDKNLTEEQQTKVKASQAITLLLDADSKLYYYEGEPDYKDYASLKEITYSADGLRTMLQTRNNDAMQQVKTLRLQKENLEIADSTYSRRLTEIKGGKNTPTIIIKATDTASYKNLIDVLDEMQICSIGKYVITNITSGDEFLIKNYTEKGALAAHSDFKHS